MIQKNKKWKKEQDFKKMSYFTSIEQKFWFVFCLTGIRIGPIPWFWVTVYNTTRTSTSGLRKWMRARKGVETVVFMLELVKKCLEINILLPLKRFYRIGPTSRRSIRKSICKLAMSMVSKNSKKLTNLSKSLFAMLRRILLSLSRNKSISQWYAKKVWNALFLVKKEKQTLK